MDRDNAVRSQFPVSGSTVQLNTTFVSYNSSFVNNCSGREEISRDKKDQAGFKTHSPCHIFFLTFAVACPKAGQPGLKSEMIFFAANSGCLFSN